MSAQQSSVAMPMAPDDPAAQRGSGGSASVRSAGSSGSGRSRQNPQQQLSTIEKSVTHLLVATKQLLETLTMWSTNRASEGEVSDVYVRLGYEFNIACRAFNAIGVDTGDLGPVPDMLRTILEETLSQDASQQSLEKYLPRIRDIIINLLHGLKKKQQRLRQRGNREGPGETVRPPRHASTASTVSVATNITEQLEDIPSRYTNSARPSVQRRGSEDLGPDLPPRTTSAPNRRSSPRRPALSPQNSISNSSRSPQQETLSTDTSSSLSSTAMQNIPVIAPYPETETMPTNQVFDRELSSLDPPKLPVKGNDALSALQRGGDLERRASRRFSAYQIQKHLGTSMNGIPAIPPAQNSPIPNRGRDIHESMTAVRSRGSVLHRRARSKSQRTALDASPNREQEMRHISEESSQLEEEPQPSTRPVASEEQQPESPNAKTPEEMLRQPFSATTDQPVGATLNGPVEEPFTPGGSFATLERTPTVKQQREKSVQQVREYTPPEAQFVPEGSPQPGKELTLFLQYKSKIKKFVLPDGRDLTFARLQLGFIEKFAWSTHNHGVDLPEIYIQDPVSGVRHELEDLSDIKDRSVLVLNVEALDEVKRHFDDGIGSLRKIVEGIRASVDDQQSSLQRVSDRQQDTAKELASLAAAPPSAPILAASSGASSWNKDKDQLREVQSLRRDLAVVRQTYTSFVSDMQASMATLRTKAASVKKAAADTTIPDMDSNSGRGYVNNGKKTLSEDSESIVNRVDDLQDLVEDLRKDVVTRGVRPLPRQLEDVSKDISVATADLKKLQEFLKREKPVWTKIWEKELQVVCDDRDLLTMQEDLAADLEDDLEKAAQTFALVEEATKAQSLQSPNGGPSGAGGAGSGPRSTSRTLKPLATDPSANPQRAKDDVLGEVRALQPNHESRLEAIERAERARQRELENRAGGEFQRELGNFVGEGRLKKSGGVEEVERVRKQREDKAFKEMFEIQQQRKRAMAEREAAAAAAAATAAAAEGENNAPSAAPPAEDRISGETTLVGDGAEPLLHVPQRRSGSESPEPGFVDAKEEVTSPLEPPL